jgi:hypothetical protein
MSWIRRSGKVKIGERVRIDRIPGGPFRYHEPVYMYGTVFGFSNSQTIVVIDPIHENKGLGSFVMTDWQLTKYEFPLIFLSEKRNVVWVSGHTIQKPKAGLPTITEAAPGSSCLGFDCNVKTK